MGKYKFVKIGRIANNENGIGTWYFAPQSVEQINEHWDKYASSVIREGSRRIVHNIFNGVTEHSTNQFQMAVEAIKPIGKGLIADMGRIEQEAYQCRIKGFLNGRTIYLSPSLSVLCLDDRFFHIINTIEKDQLTFPDEEKPSLEDVKYIVWEGGKHWYAKIGKIDVVDTKGNQKWNTKPEAEKAAKEFIELNW